MVKSDFISVLLSLNSEEFQSFCHLIRKGEIRLQNQPRLLIEDLEKSHPEWSRLQPRLRNNNLDKQELKTLHLHLDKREIYRRIFPNKEFHDQTLRNLISKAFKALKTYISEYIEEEEKELEKRYMLTRFYLERGLLKQYKKELKALEASLEKHPESFHKSEYQQKISELKLEYRVKNRVPDASFGQLLRDTRITFALKMLQIQVAMVSSARALGRKANFTELQQLLTILNHWKIGNDPRICAWTMLANLEIKGKHKKQEEFKEVIDFFEKNSQHFPPEDHKQLNLGLYNLLVRSKRSPGSANHQEIFRIWKGMHEAGILVDQKGISQHHLICTVVAGIRVKNYCWVRAFLKNCRGNINGEEADKVENLAKLLLDFYTDHDYARILREASKLHFSATKYELRLRVLISMALFCMGEYAQVEKKYETMRKYIPGREDMDTQVLQAYLAFFRELKNIALTRWAGKKITARYKEKLADSLVAEKNWILEIVGEMVPAD